VTAARLADGRIVHSKRMPQVSFIIPAYDEEVCLPRTIASIQEAATLAGVDHEIIVVDDASTDRTGEVARAHGASVHRVELRQIAAVRNAGARVAGGEILVFVDADTALPAETLSAALATLADARIVGGGSGVMFDGDMPRYARILLPVLTAFMRWNRLAAGCFIFCRRRAFEAVGGFDEAFFASEEIWLSRALGRQGRFVVLRERVVTSGRKLRQYSGWEILRLCLRITIRGPGGAKRREGLDLWYQSRREDRLPPAGSETAGAGHRRDTTVAPVQADAE